MVWGTIANPFRFGAVIIGGWKELGRVTLGSAGDNLDVTSLANKRYLMLLQHTIASGSVNLGIRLNSDTGSNYARRASANGGADSTTTSLANMRGNEFAAVTTQAFGIGYLGNFSTKEKLGMFWDIDQGTAGAGNYPSRQETVGKHAQTTDPISAVNGVNLDAGDYAAGSELVVLGYDPTDTHTDDFWQELASVEASSTVDTLDSGTISARKYLWFEIFSNHTGLGGTRIRFNSDTGNNYVYSGSTNGAADSGYASQPEIDVTTHTSLITGFIINTASREKLIMLWTVDLSAGTGAGNATRRKEMRAKWANTSNQITSLNIQSGPLGDFSAGTTIKIWGAD